MRKKKRFCLTGIVMLLIMCFSFIAYADDHEHQWKHVEVGATLDSDVTAYDICTICGITTDYEADSGFMMVSDSDTLQVGKSVSIYKYIQNATAWKSSDSKIAVIDKAGKITAKRAGKVTIIVLVNENGRTERGFFELTIQKGKVRTRTITAPRSITLKKGKSKKLDVTVRPFTSFEKVTYKSSNKKIVTVSSKGVVKAKKKGTAKIKIKSGSITFTVKVKVK